MIEKIIKNITPPLILIIIKRFINSKQYKRVVPYFKADGDNTLRLDYPINENSVIFDIGGYIGDWSANIFCKYQPNIYIFEPSLSFYNKIKKRFSNNNKVKVFNFGLSKKAEILKLNMSNDSSSMFIKKSNKYENCHIEKFDTFLERNKIDIIN